MSRSKAPQPAPATFPFVEKITERQATFSRAESAIAAYLVTYLREIPFETAASISSKLKVSPMTVGRFLRSLGYENLAALKEELGSTIHQIAWLVGERYERIASAERSKHGKDDAVRDLSVSLDLELKAVISAYEQAGTPRFGEVAEIIAKTDRVYVAGFQSVRGLAMDFCLRLEYARPRVQFMDGASGTYSELFADETGQPVLIVVDVRRYATQAMLLARQASQAGMDLVIITDSVCYWAQELTDNVFGIETDVEMFWESNAPVTTFLGLLVDDVIRRLGPSVKKRGERLQKLQDNFGSYAD
ncbi:MurR/RpiR family transcriptional regulator [Phyllobacterium zundukense]|uniref:MurR/RpiR family transcriptional regulator n=1 Tax=Phyllobacterium zundukense TaxID=1867719 RepID=A0ACD4CVJ2_9HYPH|nr:MurR/RpiR family transcriptional regulator [Phyllobacterium zundukense]UXN57612.1 MurR/RpiR family transcriptional regulator [Phyllobacterium zundukense]